jgi:diguanylate cyclase
MAYAEVALRQIKSLQQSAVPRNYEIWYVYATGHNADLNKVVNETLARNGKLTESDLDQIYDAYLSHGRATDRIDKIGARVVSEIEDVMSLISDALGLSASFGANLNGANQKLSLAGDRDQVIAVVERLVASTREMQEANQTLESRLTNSKLEINNLQQNLEAIRAESLTDPLTGLGNRKHFDRAVDEAVRYANAHGEPLSLLMIDIDHFKIFNDTYGHLTGDQVLRLVGQALKQTIKGQDIMARYGGEEFAVVLPSTTLRHAVGVAENIRRTVTSKELKKKSTGEILGRVTVSIGVSALRPDEEMYSLIERADACLYAAKRSGRNRVICETDREYEADMHVQVA